MPSHGELDHVLLVLSIHDLKRAVRGVIGILGAFSQESKHVQLRRDEATQVPGRIANVEHAARELLAGLDDILSGLDKEKQLSRLGKANQFARQFGLSKRKMSPLSGAARMALRAKIGRATCPGCRRMSGAGKQFHWRAVHA